MSITFQLEVGSGVEPLNFSNPNAAALMALAGLAPTVDGEVSGEQLRACVRRLLQIVNSESVRAYAITEGAEAPRWFEGARTGFERVKSVGAPRRGSQRNRVSAGTLAPLRRCDTPGFGQGLDRGGCAMKGQRGQQLGCRVRWILQVGERAGQGPLNAFGVGRMQCVDKCTG